MTWPDGQLIKQYTLLLDPPQRIRPARTTRSKRPAPRRTGSQTQSDSGLSAYGPVQPGETLWPIAQKLKPSGITTHQMAMALLRANPASFIDGNINKLRAGATLTIPQRVFIEQLDAKTARAEFAAQARRRQAPVVTSPRTLEAPAPAAPTQTSATAPEQANVTEPTAETPETDPQLRILTDPGKTESKAETASQPGLQKQLLVTMEEIESNRITTDAIETRLARMEAELDRMQQLVELKDAQIAALQSDIAAKEAIQAAAKIAEPPPPAPVGADRSAAPAAATRAPAPVTRIEAMPIAATPPPARPWYEEYVWVLWIILGLMGLAALLMLIRRPQPHADGVRVAELPEMTGFTPQTRQTDSAPPSAEIKEAEEDFRRLAEQALPETEPPAEPEQELPELEISQARKTDDDIDSDISESLLDVVLEGDSRLPPEPSASDTGHSEFSDDDIASWVAQLDTEAEEIETPSANDESIPADDDDIPSILTELDDQLDRSAPAASPAEIRIEPVDEVREDDTFSMSLDLARAYLEIGDQEGAKDMLEQALAGARDPEHRRQIEELLKQID
jgi:FimV-like protein